MTRGRSTIWCTKLTNIKIMVEPQIMSHTSLQRNLVFFVNITIRFLFLHITSSHPCPFSACCYSNKSLTREICGRVIHGVSRNPILVAWFPNLTSFEWDCSHILSPNKIIVADAVPELKQCTILFLSCVACTDRVPSFYLLHIFSLHKLFTKT